MKEISLYIHIPFCKQKCFYCDFPSYAGKEKFQKEYIDVLIKEIDIKCKGYIIKSIFIGGGTPSYLNENEIAKLLKAINRLKLRTGLEFTMECNPGTLSEEKLLVMKSGGVSRISFGLQSTDNSLLKGIGRVHSYEEFLKNYNLARRVGFNNINVDLMYGLPNQTLQEWKKTLEDICHIRPEHISAYSLIIEEGTPFFKMYEKNLLKLPEEDVEREMDSITKSFLEEHGYKQYEISNYSLAEKECEHNKVYWGLEEYIGVGVSSSSYIDGLRIKNIDDIEKYIKSIKNGDEVQEEIHINCENDEIEEFIFMGLRMNKGIDGNEFERRFNKTLEEVYGKIIEKHKKNNLLKLENNEMSLTLKGRELSNQVMSEFILDK